MPEQVFLPELGLESELALGPVPVWQQADLAQAVEPAAAAVARVGARVEVAGEQAAAQIALSGEPPVHGTLPAHWEHPVPGMRVSSA